MSCPDCFNNCDKPLQDQCVKYTGDPIPLLGICTGDTLSKVEEAIIEKLLSLLDGTGIVLSDVTLENCAFLKAIFAGKSKTLVNLIQLLVDSQCTLKQMIDALVPVPYVFNTACLSGLPSNPTSDDILQAALLLLCSLNTTVASFPTTYVKNSDINNIIQQYINNNNGNGGSTTVYNQRLVPYVAMPYFGPLSNFDLSGVGLSSKGFDKIYICNGTNGTPDMRGRAAVGAVRNVPGGALDPEVDPSLMANVNYQIGDKFGENYHALSANENGPHAHSVSDPGHSHSFEGVQPDGRGADDGKSATKVTKQTNSAFTGISINSSGLGTPHENRQPSIAAVWIMYVP